MHLDPNGFRIWINAGGTSNTSGAVTMDALNAAMRLMRPPTCICGCGAQPTIRVANDGSLWAADCWKAELRRRAIAQAEGWIDAAFTAAPVAARGRLYRGLAAAFHPDAGGDPAVMIALNAVRERYPDA